MVQTLRPGLALLVVLTAGFATCAAPALAWDDEFDAAHEAELPGIGSPAASAPTSSAYDPVGAALDQQLGPPVVRATVPGLQAAIAGDGAMRVGAPLSVTPAQLSFRGVRGESVSRYLVGASSHGRSPKIEDVIPVGVVSPSGLSLPPSALRLGEVKEHASGVESLTLGVDLGQIDAGSYEGTALISHAGGMEPIGLRVEVKDRPWLPLLLTLLGVVSGMALNRYQGGGRERDTLLARMGRLPPLEGPDALPAAWTERLRRLQLATEQSLRLERWDEARANVMEMEALWLRWQSWADTWRQMDGLCAELLAALGDASAELLRARELQRQVDAIRKRLPNSDTPEAATESLDLARRQVNELVRARDLLAELGDAVGDDPLLGVALDDLRARLREASGEGADLKALADEAAKLLAQIPADQRGGIHNFSGAQDAANSAGVAGLASSHGGLPTPKQADQNLQWFGRISAVITAGTLASAGFYELYISNPTFGATPWSDYASVLAWGLFSETARNAVWQSAARFSSAGRGNGQA